MIHSMMVAHDDTKLTAHIRRLEQVRHFEAEREKIQTNHLERKQNDIKRRRWTDRRTHGDNVAHLAGSTGTTTQPTYHRPQWGPQIPAFALFARFEETTINQRCCPLEQTHKSSQKYMDRLTATWVIRNDGACWKGSLKHVEIMRGATRYLPGIFSVFCPACLKLSPPNQILVRISHVYLYYK